MMKGVDPATDIIWLVSICRDLIKAGLLYFIIYLSLGLTQAPKLVWGFFGGQVASGYVTGGYACESFLVSWL